MNWEKKRLLALIVTVILTVACIGGCTPPTDSNAGTATTETPTTTTTREPVTDSTASAPVAADLPSVLDSAFLKQADTNPKPESAYAEIPAAAKAAGMTTLAFADEFDADGTIDFSGEGKAGYNWYADRPYGSEVVYTPDEAAVKDGILTFAPKTCSSSIGLSTFSSRGKNGYTMHYGYAEARIRFNTDTVSSSKETGRNGWPAFWGVSVVDVVGEQWDRVGELDILEAYHLDDNNPASGVIYTGTIHDHVKLPDGSQQIASNLINATGTMGMQDHIDNDWHTYAALWTEGYIGWYMDGVLMHAVSYTDNDYPAHYYRDIADPLYWTTTPDTENRTWPGAYSIMDDDHMVMFLGAHETWPIEVDWVRIWETPEK